jgi:hypothetical protein
MTRSIACLAVVLTALAFIVYRAMIRRIIGADRNP